MYNTQVQTRTPPVVAQPVTPRTTPGPAAAGRNGSRLLYRSALWAGDVVALALAWGFTFGMRLSANVALPEQLTAQALLSLSPSLAWVVLVWGLTAIWTLRMRSDRWSEASARDAAGIALTAGLVTALGGLMAHELGASLSRFFVVTFPAVSWLAVLSGRVLLRGILANVRPLSTRRVAVIGDPFEAVHTVERLTRNSVTAVGVIPTSQRADGLLNGNNLGPSSNLGEIINRERLSDLIFTGSGIEPDELERLALVAHSRGVRIAHAVSSFLPGASLKLASVGNVGLVELRGQEYSFEEAIRRSFDIAASAALLVILSPLFAAIAIAVRATSRGPAIYVSQRVGKGGRYFSFFKFRSMQVQTESNTSLREQNEQSGHLFKIREDPRVTPLGRFLRFYSLDELPQLVNVLLGDMSLVGPRPLPSSDLEIDGMSAQHRSWSIERARVRPGLTGLWQTKGRSELPFPAMVGLDLEYVSTRSLIRDLGILLQTPLAVLAGRGAW